MQVKELQKHSVRSREAKRRARVRLAIQDELDIICQTIRDMLGDVDTTEIYEMCRTEQISLFGGATDLSMRMLSSFHPHTGISPRVDAGHWKRGFGFCESGSVLHDRYYTTTRM